MSASFSKQKSNQDASSSGQNIGLQGSTSFGNTGSESVSTSAGQSTSSQSVFGSDVFSKLFSGASAAAAGFDSGGLADKANQLFSGGVDFLSTLGGGAGTDALKARIGDTSARDAQLGALKSGLGDFFNEQLLPGITSQGVATGTLGGSREGVAQSLAAKQVAGQYAQGAAAIIGTDQAQRDQAAAQLAGTEVQGASAGLNALQSLFGLAQGGAGASLTPFQMLSQILGGPTVLGSSQSTSISDALSSAFGQQGSQSYGFDFGTNQSQSHGASSGFSIAGGLAGGGGGKVGG